MVDVAEAINIASPYYNLAMVAIIVFLFVRLFKVRAGSHVYMQPWRVMFWVILVFIVEEITTVLRAAGIISLDVYINGYFELVIVSLVVYLLLLQYDYTKKSMRS